MKKAISVIELLMILIFVQCSMDNENDYGIIPGHSIGGIKLHEPWLFIEQHFGIPDILINDSGLFRFYYFNKGLEGFIRDANSNQLLDDDEYVIGVICFSPYKGKTDGGNGIGSIIYQITEEFGNPEHIDGKCDNQIDVYSYLWYPGEGIMVEILCSDHSVTEFYVFPAN